MNNEQTTVAELLKSARVARGLSIKAIASDICVRSSYLSAIEAADYNALPGKTFAIGFVRAYALALGQNPVDVVNAFKSEYCPENSDLEIAPVVKATKSPKSIPGWLAPIVGILGASGCWMVLGGSVTTGFMAPTDVPDVVAIEEARLAEVQATIAPSIATAQAEAASMKTSDVFASVDGDSSVSAETGATTSPAAEEITDLPRANSFFAPAVYAGGANDRSVAGNYTLRAVEDSWVRVAQADGTEVWSGILREGQTYRPEANGMLLLSTSNAGGVLLQAGNKEAESLGMRGAFVSDLKLEEARLLTAGEIGERSEFGSD